jgi:hypothetical protein
MSHLRTIMQKLAQGQVQGSVQSDVTNMVKDDVIRLHVADYQDALTLCTPSMLQYEWAWLEDHVESLGLCLSQPEMLQAMGGTPHVERLLAESRQCQTALSALMEARKVEPATHLPTMPTSEHAWEISQEKVKQLWGFHS